MIAGRREDRRLLSGVGRYSADWLLPGTLHGAFLRADRAHAKIIALDVAAARAAPGVVAVLTHADVARLAWPPCSVTYPGRGGHAILQPARPILAYERVRFVGELIALVVAASPLAAQDAVERIAVLYEDLPVVADPRDAIAAGAPQLYETIAGNTCFELDTGDEAKTAAAFERAAHVARVAVDSPRVIANPMEPRACTAVHDAATGRYTLYVPTQGLAMMRAHFARMLRIEPAQVAIVAEDVGGGFGTRSTAGPEYGALAVAAECLGRPVRWVGSRSEGFLSDSQGRANRMTGELALDRDGGFLALRFEFLSDLGAYLTPTGAMVHYMNPSFCAGGVYRIAALHGRFRQVLTNTAPVGAYRGAGRPDMAYLIERLVDRAAADLGLDRVAIRRRNFVPRDAFPYTTANGFVYDSGDFGGCLADALAAADWQGFTARRAEAAERGRLRGIGLACFIESSGGGMGPQEEVAIRFGRDGSIALHALTQSNGQGHETTFPLLMSQLLGLPAERFTLVASQADSGITGSGSFASRSLLATGSSFKAAADEVIAKARAHAALLLGVAPGRLRFEGGAFRAAGASVGIAELVERITRDAPQGLDVVASVPPSRVFPNGCHIAEVEIDPETGVASIPRYTAVDDFGNVVNPVVVAGQLHGALAQGAGQVLGERCVYDRSTGQLITGSFMDYALPRADMLGDIHIADHPVPTACNALGAKGAGEAGTTGSLPALMSAILDAVRPCGIDHLDMPVTAEVLWRAIDPRTT